MILDDPWCHYCKVRTATTRDHIVPKSKGGGNNRNNYVPCCKKCNTDKGSQLPACNCLICVVAISNWFNDRQVPLSVRKRRERRALTRSWKPTTEG